MMVRWLRRDVPQGLRKSPRKATRPRRFQVALAGGVGAAAATLLCSAGAVAAVSPPVLGTVVNYAVIGGSTITNTGATVINGGLALSPGSSVTGGPVVTGSSDINDPAAVTAQTDLSTAYTQAAASTPVTANLTGQNLGGLILTPGIYSFSSSAELTGQLTLNGEGETNPTFIFQIGSTLTTASAARVVLEDGAGACSLFLAGKKLGNTGYDDLVSGKFDDARQHHHEHRRHLRRWRGGKRWPSASPDRWSGHAG